MNSDLTKRLITSLFLLILLALVFIYSYILIILLIIVSIISLMEFHGLVSRIFTKNKLTTKFLKLLIKTLCLIYLTFFSLLVFTGITQAPFYVIFLFLICICSDIGGFIFGKIFKGKKLTKISPNKTISGSLGSFILSLTLVPLFYYFFDQFNNLFDLIVVAIIISFTSQLGDLLFSYLKRKAKVKDTGDLLPGHGGILDRIDGILFAIPVGMMIFKFLMNTI